MIRYKTLSENRRKFLAMTGYTIEEFEALLPYFQVEFENYVAVYRLDGKERTKRRYSEYKNSPLPTIEEKLLFILIYLKQGSLQEAHAALYEMHQPNANTWIHLLHRLLNQALAAAGELPAREADELAQNLEPTEAADDSELHLFFQDGTERPITRPTDKDRQKRYYSGKKNNIRSRILL
jgi:hypothetical protein